jgi:hypothetical protein
MSDGLNQDALSALSSAAYNKGQGRRRRAGREWGGDGGSMGRGGVGAREGRRVGGFEKGERVRAGRD